MLSPDRCTFCGLPAVAGGLCHHDAERALALARTVVGLLDTREDLTVREHVVDLVLALQVTGTELARWVAPDLLTDDQVEAIA